MVTAPTAPLNVANAPQSVDRHPYVAAAVAAANQKKLAPTHVHWSPVFHLAGPMAAMMTPRRAAICRKTVMNSSRPSTTATIHHGSPIGPSVDTNGNTGETIQSGAIIGPATPSTSGVR